LTSINLILKVLRLIDLEEAKFSTTIVWKNDLSSQSQQQQVV